MVYRIGWWLIAVLVLLGCAGPFASAQIPIEIGQLVEGTIVADGVAPEYVLSATGGTYLSIICDTPNRDVDLTVTLYDRFGNRIGVSTAMNFPEYWGAYLAILLPSTTNYTLRVEGEILTDAPSAVFHLLTREYADDEPDGLAISKDNTFRGLIAPAEDVDVYGIYLQRRKGPCWVTLRTPYDVLDGYLGVYTEQFEELGVNDNFIDTSPVVLFYPPEDGVYYVVVYGAVRESMGPYELTVQTVWELAPVDEVLDGIDFVGASNAYYFDLTTDQVISILVQSETAGFRPTFVFFDAWRRLVTLNQADDTGTAGIVGYTPIAAGRHVAAVFGAYDEETGDYRLVSRLEADEPDAQTIALGDKPQGIIGPVGDTDTYVFQGTGGERISVWVSPTTARLDPAVRLLGPSGELIAENDDAVSVRGSLISGVFLQETGIHTIEVLASPLLPDATGAAGVYILSVTRGTGFDISPPFVLLSALGFDYSLGQARITLPSEAVADDTWPLTATLTRDRTGESQTRSLSPDQPTQFVFGADPNEIFLLVAEDAADKPNVTDPILVPPATLVTDQVDLPYGLAVRQTGELLVIDTFSGSILEIDSNGAVNTLVEGIETKGGLLGPNALAFDHKGDLYLSNALTGEVVRVDTGGSMQAVASGLDFPVALAFDPADQLYVCLLGSDQVVRIGPDASSITVTDMIRNPSDLAFGPDGTLYVTTSEAGNGTVYIVDSGGAAVPLMEPFTTKLDSIAFDAEGNAYVADGDEGWIWRISRDGELQKLAWGFPGPTDLAFGRGRDSTILYIASMGTAWLSYFSSTIARAQTGREGLPLPYRGTEVSAWSLY